MKKRHPKVVLVGRTNVGKSALFNRLSEDSRSIVFDGGGVTRDYLTEKISWKGKQFDLVDSGGLPLGKQGDCILEAVQKTVLSLIESADLILFVCDTKSGLLNDDRRVAQILHKINKPVLLLINKVDNKGAFEENFYEFQALNFKNVFYVSALHGTGMDDLLSKIVKVVPDKVEDKTVSEYKVAIVGKPNVGKSSLMNLLSKIERSIVSDIPGTTRESISEKVSFLNSAVLLTDTAGMRRKSRVNESLETVMVKSSLRSLRESNIVLLLVDASEQQLTDQELKLLFYAYEQKKCIMIVFNKKDLLTEQERKTFEKNLKQYDFILKKVHIVWTSCKDRKNIGKVVTSVESIWKRCKQEFDSQVLMDVLFELGTKPLYKSERTLKIYKISPKKDRIPTFSLKVNHPRFFSSDQLGFVENVLRKNYDLKGCPVRLTVAKG
ncbi:ribosome biogenesis GTPase Der [Candidatus Babeliales bacterium]|nr:ribosome biogenesis GTPase Der [Candidatus Babeliales bacterium]